MSAGATGAEGGGSASSVPPAGMTAKHLAEVVQKVAAASARAGRSAPARLVAVGKTKPVEQLRECYDAGHRVFGENYAQERSIHWSPYDRVRVVNAIP